MKIGVSSYSLHKFIQQEGHDLFDGIRQAVELGFEGIEFLDMSAYAGDTDPAEFARRVKQACEDAGLPIVCYTVGADFLQPTRGAKTIQQEIDRIKGEVQIAAELGAPCMRHDATRGFPEGHVGPREFPHAVPMLADACGQVTALAKTLGIRTSVENHGFFVQDSQRCETLVRAVADDNFGALIDIGNFLCADEDPVSAVRRMAPYAVHCHAKDFHVKPASAADPGRGWFRSRGGAYLRGAIVGHGTVDLPACLALLTQAGYDGWLSIEFEGLEDCLLGLEIGLANLRAYLGE